MNFDEQGCWISNWSSMGGCVFISYFRCCNKCVNEHWNCSSSCWSISFLKYFAITHSGNTWIYLFTLLSFDKCRKEFFLYLFTSLPLYIQLLRSLGNLMAGDAYTTNILLDPGHETTGQFYFLHIFIFSFIYLFIYIKSKSKKYQQTFIYLCITIYNIVLLFLSIIILLYSTLLIS